MRLLFELVPILVLIVSLVLLPFIRKENRLGWAKRLRTATTVLGALVYSLVLFADTYVDSQWFGELGQSDRFITVLQTRAALFAFGGIVGLVAVAACCRSTVMRLRASNPESSEWLELVWSIGQLFVSVGFGWLASTDWQRVLLFWHGGTFDLREAVFGRDAGFYVFTLPLLDSFRFGSLLLLATVVVVRVFAATWEFNSGENYDIDKFIWWEGSRRGGTLSTFAWRFLPVLLAAAAVWCVFSLQLSRYSLLYTPSARTPGPGWTEIHVQLPILRVLQLAFLALAAFFVRTAMQRRWTLTRWRISAIGFALINLSWLVFPAMAHSIYVRPSEREIEMPFIERGIEFTRTAYALKNVERVSYRPAGSPTLADIRGEHAVVDNIRLADWQMMHLAYSQLQELRQYYDFPDVDVDRYTVDGKLRNVMLASREVNTSQLPTESQTWENLHLNYTHGYGVVGAFSNAFTPNGLPKLFMQNIPPASSEREIQVNQPRIYFGELTTEHVFVNTAREEFDYPADSGNETSRYDGKAGFPIGGGIRRFLTALGTDGFRVLASNYLTADSRVLLRREIDERLDALAPFLWRDNDPYKVVRNDGSLVYVVDMYTESKRFPYAQHYGSFNYMRNPVKAVVDAYNGTVDLYVVDDSDPLIQMWQRAFPGMFKSGNEMPVDIRAHVRYPEGYFSAQAHIYADYHMDASAFYMREDRYQVANEIYVNDRVQVQPYYVITALPGSTAEEFLLMLPFTPAGKDNLVAWMGARCSAGNCNRLTTYDLTHEALTWGPAQIEAKIDAHPEMSSQLTLWKQKGSEVVRGNMLAIPTRWGVLYVEPIYLVATNAALPELTRVVVGWGENVEWGSSFDDALAKVFGDSVQEPSTKTVTSPPPSKAGELLDSYLRLTGEGKLIEAAKSLEALRKLLLGRE